MKRLILFFIFFAEPIASHAECSFFSQRPNVFQEFNELVAQGEDLSKDRNFRVIGVLNTDLRETLSGAWNLGVLEISSPQLRPSAVLKLSHAGYLDYERPQPRTARLKHYVAAHKVLGDLHAAPQLHALLDHASVDKVLKRRSVTTALYGRHGPNLRSEIGANQWVGMVMDVIYDPHPLSRRSDAPPFLIHWCEAHLYRALSEMVEIRRRVMYAGIHLNDQQLVVNRDGHVYLIDVDGYFFDEVKSQQTNFVKEASTLIERWQAASGKTLDPTLYGEYLRQLEVAHPVCVAPVTSDLGEWRNFSPINCGNEQESKSLESLRRSVERPAAGKLNFKMTFTSATGGESDVADQAVRIWPELSRRYQAMTFFERLSWLGVLYGTTKALRIGLARALWVTVLFLPTVANAQEVPGFFASPEGLDYLFQQNDPRFAEFVIRSQPDVARKVMGLSLSFFPENLKLPVVK